MSTAMTRTGGIFGRHERIPSRKSLTRIPFEETDSDILPCRIFPRRFRLDKVGDRQIVNSDMCLWPATIRGPLFDSVMLDADGDGRAELFLAMRAAPDLLLSR